MWKLFYHPKRKANLKSYTSPGKIVSSLRYNWVRSDLLEKGSVSAAWLGLFQELSEGELWHLGSARRFLHLDILQISWSFKTVDYHNVEYAVQPLQMRGSLRVITFFFLQNLDFSYQPDSPLYEIWAMWRAHTCSIPHCLCTGPWPSLTHTMASSEICPSYSVH